MVIQNMGARNLFGNLLNNVNMGQFTKPIGANSELCLNPRIMSKS